MWNVPTTLCMPHVQYMLDKARVYTVFVDLDLANSFHKIRLAEEISHMLSVQTPWGLVRPSICLKV